MNLDLSKIGPFNLRDFGKNSPIALSALVTLEDEEEESNTRYFLAPVGGGARLNIGTGEVLVITPSSPLGRAMLGKSFDDEIAVQLPKGRCEFLIVKVA